MMTNYKYHNNKWLPLDQEEAIFTSDACNLTSNESYFRMLFEHIAHTQSAVASTKTAAIAVDKENREPV